MSLAKTIAETGSANGATLAVTKAGLKPWLGSNHNQAGLRNGWD